MDFLSLANYLYLKWAITMVSINWFISAGPAQGISKLSVCLGPPGHPPEFKFIYIYIYIYNKLNKWHKWMNEWMNKQFKTRLFWFHDQYTCQGGPQIKFCLGAPKGFGWHWISVFHLWSIIFIGRVKKTFQNECTEFKRCVANLQYITNFLVINNYFPLSRQTLCMLC